MSAPPQSQAPGGATALGRRHADVSVARRNPLARPDPFASISNLAPDMEAGVEIDPRRLTRDHVAALREAGFNRASIGVQDFNATVQAAVHRIQPREQTEQAIAVGARGRFSIRQPGLDLRFALPDGRILRQDPGGDHRAGAGPAGGVQLRARAVDEAGAKDSGTGGRLAQRRNQAEHSKTGHREADAERPLHLHRHGSLCAARR